MKTPVQLIFFYYDVAYKPLLIKQNECIRIWLTEAMKLKKYENFARNFASKFNPAFRKAQDLIDDNTELEPVIFKTKKWKQFWFTLLYLAVQLECVQSKFSRLFYKLHFAR